MRNLRACHLTESKLPGSIGPGGKCPSGYRLAHSLQCDCPLFLNSQPTFHARMGWYLRGSRGVTTRKIVALMLGLRIFLGVCRFRHAETGEPKASCPPVRPVPNPRLPEPPPGAAAGTVDRSWLPNARGPWLPRNPASASPPDPTWPTPRLPSRLPPTWRLRARPGWVAGR